MKLGMFWGLVLAIIGAAIPFVIVWWRHVALATRVTAHRQLTGLERDWLRRRRRLSLIAFVLFWPTAIGLGLAAWVLQPSPLGEWIVFLSIVLAAAVLLGSHLNTRCPVCRYRLGLQRSLGVPAQCERCRVRLLAL